MTEWRLLIAAGRAQLVDLAQEVQDLPGVGRFRSELLRDTATGEEFDLVGTPARLLEPTLFDLVADLERGPQAILPRDLAWIAWILGLEPGDTVIEGGAGSGALTLTLARIVVPDGRVISYEPRLSHRRILERNLQRSPHAALVKVVPQELTPDSEPLPCQALVLDVPQPWELVSWAATALESGGRLVAYLPTTGQVAQLVAQLEGWGETRVVENLQRDWTTRSQALRPQSRMQGHSGFIVSARHYT